MDQELSDLLEYCQLNNRVCPKPSFWIQLWNLLLTPKQRITEWKLYGPPIHSAWFHTTNSEKSQRFFEHLIWACNHGLFEEIDRFVRSLPEDQWHHLSE